MSRDVSKAPDSRRNRCSAEVVGLVPIPAEPGRREILMYQFRFVRKRTLVASGHPGFDLLIGSKQRRASAAMLRLDEKMSTPAP
jgi:hypothetical protein